jgi:hypothetical protein
LGLGNTVNEMQLNALKQGSKDWPDCLDGKRTRPEFKERFARLRAPQRRELSMKN